jgi:hypothetical protein
MFGYDPLHDILQIALELSRPLKRRKLVAFDDFQCVRQLLDLPRKSLTLPLGAFALADDFFEFFRIQVDDPLLREDAKGTFRTVQ